MLKAIVKDTEINIGDTVRVHSLVIEGSKQRVQVFEGIIIALSGRGEDKTMTVRRIGVGSIGIERKWPLNARTLVKVEIVKHAKHVRRSKLYYLRNLIGQAATRV